MVMSARSLEQETGYDNDDIASEDISTAVDKDHMACSRGPSKRINASKPRVVSSGIARCPANEKPLKIVFFKITLYKVRSKLT